MARKSVKAFKANSDYTFETAHLAYDKGNFRKAFKLFKKGAESGDIDCMIILASMYTCGEGVCCDYDKAVEWERLAVDYGSISAMINLGISYRIKGDLRQAKYWFQKALDSGDGEAALELAKLYIVSDKEKKMVKEYLINAISNEQTCKASVEEATALLEEIEQSMSG